MFKLQEIFDPHIRAWEVFYNDSMVGRIWIDRLRLYMTVECKNDQRIDFLDKLDDRSLLMVACKHIHQRLLDEPEYWYREV